LSRKVSSHSSDPNELWAGGSIPLLKSLGILTQDGKINADSRRKLKQIYHLTQLIEPLIESIPKERNIRWVDVGAGKSYLGFILVDLILKNSSGAKLWSIERDQKMVERAQELAKTSGFEQMIFSAHTIEDAPDPDSSWNSVSIVSALHACDTATDDAILFALQKNAQAIVLVPCCQAELARSLKDCASSDIGALYSAPLHAREFGTLLTNVIRVLFLKSKGYAVRVTELNGWEHSLKSEILIAEKKGDSHSPLATQAKDELHSLLLKFPNLKMKLLSTKEESADHASR
jgi:hypothetical protein